MRWKDCRDKTDSFRGHASLSPAFVAPRQRLSMFAQENEPLVSTGFSGLATGCLLCIQLLSVRLSNNLLRAYVGPEGYYISYNLLIAPSISDEPQSM